VTTLTPATLAADLRETAFAAPIRPGSAPRRIGAEAEFIPVDALTGRRCPIESGDVAATLPFLRRYGERQHWQEGRTSKGTPCFTLPDGGNLTFEPGGQLEYSSAPCWSGSDLLHLLRTVVQPLRASAADEGIILLACGIDPLNAIDESPLLVNAKRYERMAEYLGRRGGAGAQMMRQTAAFQISLDFNDDTWLRWRVLNAAAPYLAAIFANSPIYARQDTGWQSARTLVWRNVDPLRTGIPYAESDPVQAYLDFALAAPAILCPTFSDEALPFAQWLTRADPTLEEWHEHLSTLFPEVRPRGHVELRSIDAIAPEWYAAPIAVCAGIVYDPGTLRTVNELLGAPDARLLDQSGREGLHDPVIGRTAAALFELALDGCRRLPPGYFEPSDLEEASAFFERYTRRGRAPADELVESAVAA
jgi:glutamate--cysteine ligase